MALSAGSLSLQRHPLSEPRALWDLVNYLMPSVQAAVRNLYGSYIMMGLRHSGTNIMNHRKLHPFVHILKNGYDVLVAMLCLSSHLALNNSPMEEPLCLIKRGMKRWAILSVVSNPASIASLSWANY